MKITDIETVVVREAVVADIADSSQDAALILVHTDTNLTGIGEVDSSPEVVRAIVEAPRSHVMSCGLRELLLGEDPLDVDRLWEKMYQGSIFFGRRGCAIQAMSGVDIALWDLCGKALNLPIHKLLGGAYRDWIPVYASVLMPETPEATKELARSLREDGFSAAKFGWGPLGKDAELDQELIEAARAGLGDDGRLLIDIGFAWRDAATAIERIRGVERYRPFWIEEPLPPDDLGGYAAVAGAVDTRIAAGEQETTRWAFLELIDRAGIDVLQPDVTRVGGFTEARRISALAHSRNVPIVPHAWSSDITQAATAHFIASMASESMLEYHVSTSDFPRVLVEEPLTVKAGRAEVPTASGLGVELNLEGIDRYRVD